MLVPPPGYYQQSLTKGHWLIYLEMRTGNGFGELMEKRILYFGEFPRVHDLEYVLNFVKEHHLLGAIHFWPIPQ
jgi:hypothetical protein